MRIVRLFGWAVFCWLIVVAILPDPARALPRHQAPAGREVMFWRDLMALLLLERVPFLERDSELPPPRLSWRVHGDFGWIMRDKATAWCCDPQDCFEVDDAQVHQLRGVWYVNGRPVDRESVYPSKHKTMAFVACFRPDGTPRCLFLPLNG